MKWNAWIEKWRSGMTEEWIEGHEAGGIQYSRWSTQVEVVEASGMMEGVDGMKGRAWNENWREITKGGGEVSELVIIVMGSILGGMQEDLEVSA